MMKQHSHLSTNSERSNHTITCCRAPWELKAAAWMKCITSKNLVHLLILKQLQTCRSSWNYNTSNLKPGMVLGAIIYCSSKIYSPCLQIVLAKTDGICLNPIGNAFLKEFSKGSTFFDMMDMLGLFAGIAFLASYRLLAWVNTGCIKVSLLGFCLIGCLLDRLEWNALAAIELDIKYDFNTWKRRALCILCGIHIFLISATLQHLQTAIGGLVKNHPRLLVFQIIRGNSFPRVYKGFSTFLGVELLVLPIILIAGCATLLSMYLFIRTVIMLNLLT